MAEARTTLLSSVFMSATVWRTVASKVASSRVSTPAFAWPRATRPTRPKISERNGIKSSPLLLKLRCQAAQQTAGRQYIHQQEMHAGQDIVFVIRPHVLQFAEIVQRDGDLAIAGRVELKMRSRDAVVGGQHLGHYFEGNGGFRRHRAWEREKQDIALQDGLQADPALDFANLESVGPRLGDFIPLLGQQRMNVPQFRAGCSGHRC